MKFRISKEDLNRGLNLSAKSMLTKSSLPVLANIFIKAGGEGVEMVATSLETAIKIKINCKVEREGETTILGRALMEFVAQLGEGEVLFEKLGEEVVVATGNTSARFATISPDEFPAIPKVEGGRKVMLAAGDFSKNINRVFFCAAQDESRPMLAGVLFDGAKGGVNLVATDGFRLGSSRVGTVKSEIGAVKLVLPARAVGEIPKIISDIGADGEGNVEMVVSDNLSQVVFRIDNVEFTSRLIEGVYPQWEKLIPVNFATKVTVGREELIRAIKVAAIFAKDAGNIVKVKIFSEGKKGFVAVSSNTAQIGSSDSHIEANIEGNGGEIAFNFRYVLEALSSIDSDEVVFEMNESLNPGRLSSAGGDSFFHIIMPVRLQN